MGNFQIINPAEDCYGNRKENIFIAFDDQHQFLGSGYVFPNLNFEMAPEHPMNIYLDIHMANSSDLGNEVCCELLSKLQERAQEIKERNQDVAARLYFGCIGDENKAKYDFFVSKGFIHDEGTHLLQMKMSDYAFDAFDIKEIEIKENDFANEHEKDVIIQLHNDIFIKTIDHDFFAELTKHEIVKHFTAYHNGHIIGHIIVYANKDLHEIFVGKIENLFVQKPWRNKKIAKQLMDAAMGHLRTKEIDDVQLEVWSANKGAYQFYEKLGFQYRKETEKYPGIYL